jgi:hypothetical protein
MPDIAPEPVAMQPRRDEGAADARTLEQMGRLEPQPNPAPAPSIRPFLEPGWPAEEPA